MTTEELIKMIHLVIDYENIVMNILYKFKESHVPYGVATEVRDYLQNIINQDVGDPVLGLDLVDKAVYCSHEELVAEIEYIKSL